MGKNRRTVKKRRTARKSRTAKKRQNGGVIFMGAPVSYSIPFGQRQPTEAIMERATTAGGGGANSEEDTNPSEVTITNNRPVNNRVVNNSSIQTNSSEANLRKSQPVSYLKNTTLKEQYEKENFKGIIDEKLYTPIKRIVHFNNNNYIKLRINGNWSKGPGLIISECLKNNIPVEIAKEILSIYIKSYDKFTESPRIAGYTESLALDSANKYAIQEATKAINNYKSEKPLEEGLLKYNKSGKPLNQVPQPASTSFFSRLRDLTGGKYKRTHHKRANRKHTHRNKRN